MKKYRVRPAQIEAVQFTGGRPSADSILTWMRGLKGSAEYFPRTDEIRSSRFVAKRGDFVCHHEGSFFSVSSEHFAKIYEEVPLPLLSRNRDILLEAYDDGNGGNLDFVHGEGGYFLGMYDGAVIYEGIEVDGTLYSLVPASGGGSTTVILDRGLVENDPGVSFATTAEAKAYVRGLTAK